MPKDVRDKAAEYESNEEAKRWMNLNARGKLALTTIPKLIRIMDEDDNWKTHFQALVRDKALITQTRLIGHTRNTVCDMSPVTAEEHERVQQAIRAWFRVIASYTAFSWLAKAVFAENFLGHSLVRRESERFTAK